MLTRGFTLHPQVLLIGGPHAFFPGLVEAWRAAIPKTWAERKVEVDLSDGIEKHIFVPDGAEDFAALGAVLSGLEEGLQSPLIDPEIIRQINNQRRQELRSQRAGAPLVRNKEELDAFLQAYERPPFKTAHFTKGEQVEAYLGIDGGSTSTKAVLLDRQGQVLAKSYRLSCGNPIADVKQLGQDLSEQIESQGASLKVLGCATTGYAKDLLKDALLADVALVETVAHAKSAVSTFGRDVDVICDVGGQDIKLIFMRDGNVVDFRLNTQCSAGNGYFLQGTALGFGLPVEQYAEHAFKAESAPEFSYGCAVFLQSDTVDFQRFGFTRDEILAGLCRVLPKNIWLYIAKIPNLAHLGRRFVLQGGTQYNLAAVKAQVDYIVERFAGSGVEPDVQVHPHAGESGAIGAALEAQRLAEEQAYKSKFIGLEALANLEFGVTRDESTRCSYCNNHCMRTFIDLDQGQDHHRQLVVAPCETGMAASQNEMKSINAAVKQVKNKTPNLVEVQAKKTFQATELPAEASDAWRLKQHSLGQKLAQRWPGFEQAQQRRQKVRIGIPRVLTMYSLAPFFRAYFETLGLPAENVVYSPVTTEKLYRAGATRGAIDPCFPSKLALSHVHHLLMKTHARKPLDVIFFPMIDRLPPALNGTVDNRACPTTATTPTTARAAFTKEHDLFAERGVQYMTPFLQMHIEDQVEKELREHFGDILALQRRENRRAVSLAYQHLSAFKHKMRTQGGLLIRDLEQRGDVGVVLLSRPYHTDPGVNHGIAEELQKIGYPVISTDSLPLDDDELVEKIFALPADEARRVDDVWKNSFSENTNRKIWAAKFVARHPNLVALELSSFKCGHDAAVNTVVEKILAASGTPHFAFKEIDENRPAGAIKIRVETIAYFLERYKQRLRGLSGGVDLGVKIGKNLRPKSSTVPAPSQEARA